MATHSSILAGTIPSTEEPARLQSAHDWACTHTHTQMNVMEGCLGCSVEKTPPANAGDKGLIHLPGRSPGEGNSNPLHYSCLENLMTEEPGGLWPMRSQQQQWSLSLLRFHSRALSHMATLTIKEVGKCDLALDPGRNWCEFDKQLCSSFHILLGVLQYNKV